MEQERHSLRVGITVIAVAAIWRILGFWLPGAAASLNSPAMASTLLFFSTGRTAAPTEAAVTPAETEVPVTEAVAETEPGPLQLSEALPLPELLDAAGKAPSLEQLLRSPLEWDLKGEGPRVLILHTHATEGYTGTYEGSETYRSRDAQYNMLCVGDYLARLLEQRGIPVIHDRTLHDYPSYNGSYGNSRKTAQTWLAEYPTIQVVLDLHRDAVQLPNGSQLRPSVTIDGKETAQLMLVVGTNGSGLNHPGWQKNLSIALKLHALLEQQAPGITRPIYLRRERFNQDLLPGALLVEVGAAGNTQQEALHAVEVLADALEALARGAVS